MFIYIYVYTVSCCMLECTLQIAQNSKNNFQSDILPTKTWHCSLRLGVILLFRFSLLLIMRKTILILDITMKE